VQALGIAAAGDHFDVAADEIRYRARPACAAAIDEPLRDDQVGRTEACQPGAPAGDRNPGRRQVRLAGAEQREQPVEARRHDNFQIDAELLGKAPDQLVLETFDALGTDVIGGRAVHGRDPQHADRLDLLQHARRLAGTTGQGGGQPQHGPCPAPAVKETGARGR